MATKQPGQAGKRTTKTTPTRKTAAKTPRRKTPVRMEVPQEEIRKRAYEIFRARGARHGQDVDDWLQAEQELRGARRR